MPFNVAPIQPRLAESNLFLISARGPGALSFNEFNPLFNRNGISLLTSSLVGNNDTCAGEGVISGIYNKTSFSVAGFHFTTNGFRRNNEQKDDIANAFIQQELSPQTSIQGEYRYRNTNYGDLALRFFPEDFFPGRRNGEERYSYRFGGRHAFSPNSLLLGSFIYQDADFGLRDESLFGAFKANRPENAFGTELQHLFSSRYVNLASGAGYFHVDGRIDTTFQLDLPPPPDGPGPIVISDTTSTDLHHGNMYVYSYVNLLKKVTLTVGASVDLVRGDSPDVGDRDQFNPKFGITWEPIPGTTLRAAVFRVLKRTLMTDQTIEPTQVAGFNQFFDDPNGTEAWRYGGAIDQKLTQSIFGGVEFAKRDLQVPFVDFTDPSNPRAREEATDEYLGRAYLFWTPPEWLALRAEYLFERLKSEGLTEQPKELDTHRVPVGFNFFHPAGLGSIQKIALSAA